MTQTFVDTAFVVALVNDGDELHPIAMELGRRFAGRPLLATDAVLFEVGNSLSRGLRQEAVRVIDNFLISKEVEVVETDRKLLNQAIDFYRQHEDKTWGLTDGLSFVVMRERGLTDALTYDQHFVQAGFNALMRDR